MPCLLTLSLSLLAPVRTVHAADNPDVTLTNGQTETVNSSQPISFNNMGDNSAISIKGTSTATANKITVSNSGTITTAPGSGSGRAIRDASGSSNSVINNNAGGLITSSGDDTISVTAASGNTTASIIDVENHGTIQALDANGSGTTTPGKSGNQAINVAATTNGDSTINNYSNGVIWATGGDAVRPGANGVVNNDGFIYSNAYYSGTGTAYSGTGSDGIDAEGKSVSGTNFNLVVSGVTIVNGATTTKPGGTVAAYQSSTALSGYVGAITNVPMTESTIEGGRHGITGGNTGVQGGTAQYGGYLGDGSYSMTITNNQGALIEGQDGSGINIDGFGIQNGTKFYTNENVTVTNYGTITGSGQSRDGDGVDVDGEVIINNQGSIISKNASPEASDPAGTVEFSEGVTVGGGTITNGSSTNSTATIEGEVAAGNTQAVGRGITLAGIDHDASDVDFPIESIYENSSITNSGLIKGDSDSGIAVLGTTGGGYSVTITNNATGDIVGNNTGISERGTVTYNSVTSSNGLSLNQGAIELDDTGNTYEIDNYGTITQSGTSGVAVAMHSSSSNVLNVYGGSIGGDVAGDTSSDSTLTIDPGANSSFTFTHSISNFAVNLKSGTFALNGTISGGTTTIESGATLAGNNTVGALVIAAGGTLSPGNSPGKTSATSAVFNPTGNFLLQVDTDGSTGTAGTNWDQLADSGTLDVSALGAGNTFVFDLQSLNGSDQPGSLTTFNHDANHVWQDVVTTAGFIGTVSAADFTVNTSQFNEGLDGSFSIQQDGNNLDLVYTAVPEPSTWALLLGGGGLLVAIRRFRHRQV